MLTSRRTSRQAALIVLAAALAGPVDGASYLPLPDGDLVRRSPVIVVAQATGQTDFAAQRPDEQGPAYNLTPLLALDVLKGTLPLAAFKVRLLGGSSPDGLRSWFPGTPEFLPGQVVLLFLDRIEGQTGEYGLTELALSKFDVMEDGAGRLFAVRTAFQAGDEVILSADGGLSEPDALRELDSFLTALRASGRGEAFRSAPRISPYGTLRPHILGRHADWVNLGGREGTANLFRWFWDTGGSPNAVVKVVGTQSNLTDGSNGTSAVTAAIAGWTGVSSSDVRYSGPSGSGNVTITLDLASDPGGAWSAPMDCALGLLGIGGITSATGPAVTFKGDNYYVNQVGFVNMRKNTCASGYDATTFRSAVLHEVGHTVGLGHPDQASSTHSTTTSTDWNNAVMRSFIPAAHPQVPQTDDIQAIQYYYPAGAASPTVTSVSPSSGPTSGGTSVTITGTNFTSGASVTFGGAAASSVVVNSSTSISCRTPTGSAGAVTVSVTTSAGTGSLTNGFTYTAVALLPTVSSVSPSSGPTSGGTSVTITGTNFTSGASVTFGGAAASSVVVNSSTSISCRTPAGSAGAVTVSVTTSAGTGSLTNGFTYTGGGTGCTPNSTTLCLNSSRFRLTTSWKNYNTGASATATAVPLTNDTGYFWFFASTNVELVVKVLDGRGVNGYFWVMYGALSDVEYTITITDTVTGVSKPYYNPPHSLASFADTRAFATVRPGLAPASSDAREEMAEELARAELGLLRPSPPQLSPGAADRAASLLSTVPQAERRRAFPLYRYEGVPIEQAARLFSGASAALYLHETREALILSETAVSNPDQGASPQETGRFLGIRTIPEFVEEVVANHPQIAAGGNQYLLKLPSVAPAPEEDSSWPGASGIQPAPLAASTVVSEGWESGWSSRWTRSDNTNGQYQWTATNCTVHSGSAVADMMGGTIGGTLSCSAAYPNNYDAWMIYSSCVNIQNASSASLTYWLNINSETTYDYLGMLFKRTSDGLYYGHRYSGYSGGFQQFTDNLKSWPTIGDLTQISCNSLAIAFHSDSSAAPGFGARVDDLSLTATTGGGGVPCTPSGTALCLSSSRFKVEVQWTNYNTGAVGSAAAVPLTNDTGYFWFFSSANVELVVKVLDGTGVNGKFWVFYGALSDVGYTITITDSQTGLVKQYNNPAHTLASVADTNAF